MPSLQADAPAFGRFQDDTTGKRFAKALSEKAADGVKVRVLYDWFGSAYVSRSFWRGLREAGVRIFEYGGPMIHAKTVVVDGWWSKVGRVHRSD